MVNDALVEQEASTPKTSVPPRSPRRLDRELPWKTDSPRTSPLLGPEQLVAPGDRVLQRPLARRRVARTKRGPGCGGRRAARPAPAGATAAQRADREQDAVEAATDLPPPRVRPPRAARRDALPRPGRGEPRASVSGRSGGTWSSCSPREAQGSRLVTQNHQLRASLEQLATSGAASIRCSKLSRRSSSPPARWRPDGRADRRRLANSQRACDRQPDQIRRGDAVERDEGDAVAKRSASSSAASTATRVLPVPRPGQRPEPNFTVDQQRPDLGQLGGATHGPWSSGRETSRLRAGLRRAPGDPEPLRNQEREIV